MTIFHVIKYPIHSSNTRMHDLPVVFNDKWVELRRGAYGHYQQEVEELGIDWATDNYNRAFDKHLDLLQKFMLEYDGDDA